MQTIAEARGKCRVHFPPRRDCRRGTGRQISAARFGIELSRDGNPASRRRETFHAAAADLDFGSLRQERKGRNSARTTICSSGRPDQSRWSYASAKLTDEFLALAYSREKKLPVIIARLFNTVGPRQTGRYGMVLPRFIAAAKKNEPLKVFGDGKQSRCFCLVNDVVEALVRLQELPETARAARFSTSAARRRFPFWNWRSSW